jgi:hypothetical protein
MLGALDRALTEPTELHCLGGFVLAEHYRLTRPTADIDVVESAGTDLATLARLAGRGSALHRRYRVFIDVVAVADVPEDYVTRLIDMEAGFERVRLRAFERHDLVLAKLSRNIDRDREDLMALARGPGVDVAVLERRYREELRPKLARPDREDLTLALWVELIGQTRAAGGRQLRAGQGES